MSDWLFKQYWRINKARELISLLFWVFMFVGIWTPLVQIVFPTQKYVIAIMLTILSVLGALLIGYAYDKMNLWKQQDKQALKRQLAASTPLEKESKYLVPLQLETARAVYKQTKNKKLKQQIDLVEKWLQQ